MITRIECDNIITDGKIFGGYVYFDNGTILSVTESASLPYDKTVCAEGCYLAPGFIDSHTHGAAGVDFTSCTPEEAVLAVNYHAAHGTTTIFPTTLAADYGSTRAALSALRAAQKSGAAKAHIAGVHIEGPYFAPRMAGAQNPKFLTDPVESEYVSILNEFGGFVKKWSYAPERDKGGKFCKYLTEQGVFASAGHTEATLSDMKTAYDCGLRGITHLYSCTSTITREQGFRRLGVTECAYYFEDIFAELIADGRHIPPELISLVFRLKGARHIMLVTDSLSVTGCGKFEGMLNGVAYIVEDGVAKLRDRSAFAGSVATTDGLVRECVAAGVPLAEAVRAASETPARAYRLRKGRIAAGYDADFVLLNGGLAVKSVWVSGNEIYTQGENI